MPRLKFVRCQRRQKGRKFNEANISLYSVVMKTSLSPQMYVIDVINESIKLNVTNLNRSYSYRNGTRKCEYIIFFLPQTYYVL